MAQAKKGLGRGLSALIPTDDMDFLAEVARGDFSILDSPPNANGEAAPRASTVSRETDATATTDAQDASRSSSEEASQEARAGTALEEAEPRPLQEEDTSVPGAGVRSRPRGKPQVARQDNGVDVADVVRWVEPDLIEPNPFQPRRSFDEGELANLADSIREHGVLQPIIVRPIGMGPAFGLDAEQSGRQYQLVAGERRWRASKAAGLERVPVVVREMGDQQALELAIIENVQRHDISALDAALAYKKLAQEFGLSQERIAARVGKSRPSIANTLRLLELPPEAQEALGEGALSEGHGRAILLAPRDSRRAVLRAVLRDKLSVRDAEEFARRVARQAERDAQIGAEQISSREAVDIEQGGEKTAGEGASWDGALEEQLQRALSCRVQVRRRRAGGQIVLFAADDEQLERLASALAGGR